MIFDYLTKIEQIFSTYIGFVLICSVGLYLTIYSKGFQFKVLANVKKNIINLAKENTTNSGKGVSPFKLYFTSLGGMMGIGNIVGIGSAVTIGGPGSIFWMWIASCCGMLMKYCEIYLGVKYRVKNDKGGYDGGPMFFLRHAFSGMLGKYLAYLSAILLCIYAIEIFQFTVVAQSISLISNIDLSIIIGILLILVIIAGTGGISRLANICAVLMPILMGLYISICLFIIIANAQLLPTIFYQIFSQAFTGSAQIGGFIGSTLILCGYQGTSAIIYAQDICIGYDSVIQSETKITQPRKQAELSIYAIFSDMIICSLTALIVTITGAWHNMCGTPQTQVISQILQNYIPFSEIFMVMVLTIAGYTTISAFFAVGLKSANFISKKYGSIFFIPCAITAFIFFAYCPPAKAKTIMLISGMLLVLINTLAIFKLRKEIDFSNYE